MSSAPPKTVDLVRKRKHEYHCVLEYSTCIETERSLEHFDIFAHTSLGEAPATPYLDGFVGDIVGGASGAYLQQANGAGQVLCLLLVRHMTHLVSNGFQPGLIRFDESDHLGQPESRQSACTASQSMLKNNSLPADDGLVNEALAEDKTLVGPFQTLLGDEPVGTRGAACESYEWAGG